ncbi:hypothetical protein Tco_1238392 [Tanacetum coccineum]
MTVMWESFRCGVEEKLIVISSLLMIPPLIVLHHWLDVSLNYPVLSSLLILSRARLFLLHVDTVGVTSLPFEYTISERQRKLEKWEEEAKKKHLVKSSKDVALQEMTNAIAAYAPQQLCKVRSKHNKYNDIAERVARCLNLDDPATIRLTSHNYYSR